MDKNNKILVGILSCLTVVILGLTITIIVVFVTSNNKEELLCVNLENEQKQSRCLDTLLETNGLEVARKSYEEIYDTYVKNEKYSDAVSLRGDWMDSLVEYEQCGEIMRLLDNNDVEQFPPNDLFEYYSMAIENSELCNNQAKSDEFWDKYYVLGNSGRVRVPTTQELVEGTTDDRDENEKKGEDGGSENE